MATTYTYPHWETNVIDNSIYNATYTESLPLLRPIFFMRAAKGPAGVPTWVSSYNEARDVFGEATFDVDSEFYSREALYLTQLFSRQGAFVTRMVSSDAKRASCVLELQVRKTDVIQYQRDAEGYYIYDVATGDRIPATDPETGATIVEPGIELKWMVRPLDLNSDNPETLTGLKPTTYSSGDSQYTVYPILAATANYVGSAYNATGFKFFVDLDALDETLAENVQALPYEFGAVEKAYGDDTVSPLYSNFQNQFESVILKPNSRDTRIDKNVSFTAIMNDEYADVLPFSTYLYTDNIKTIGEMIQEVEPDDETLTDPYLVNLTAATNIDGLPMPHVVFSEDDDSVILNDTRILYLSGGEDGSIDDTAVEALTRQYLTDLVYPELLDQPRYPFTHIFDTGVTIETKRAFIEFLGTHDACKIVLSTQDAHMSPNTKNEDMSINLPVASYSDVC